MVVPRAASVPSLSWLCLQRLARFADDVHHLPVRLNYLPDTADVLHGPLHPHPLLWATLVQVYDNLPSRFHALPIPLADPHLPCLQRIPHTPRFSLLTILDLPACPHLTDSSVVTLSPLHSLVALDASATSLTAYGIKALAGTLLWVDDGPHRRGPWPLRILRLRYCVNVNDDVYPHLSKFPLLSVVDLRGTDCWPAKDSAFQPSSEMTLFHPSPLAAAVDSLTGQDLYSSPNTFNLVISTLNHPVSKEPGSVVIPQESYVFIPSAGVKTESKKDRSSNDHQLQPVRKKCVIPKYLTRVEGDVSRHYNCEGSEDYDTDEPEKSDEDAFQQRNSPLTKTLLSGNHPPTQRIHASFSNPLGYLSESTPDLFYLTPLSSRTPQKYDPQKNYSAQMYYARFHFESLARPTSRHDAWLALYRTPPPWSALEVHSARLQELAHARSRSVARQRAGLSVAVVNRAHARIQIAQPRIDALRESASATRRSAVGAPQTPTPSSEVSASVLGRNPFRKQLPSMLEDSSRGMKPLKPISAVKVPLLPEPTVETQKHPPATSGAGASRIKSSGLESASFAGSSPSGATSQLKRTAVTRTWAGIEQGEGTRSSSNVGTASAKKVKVVHSPVFGGKTKAREKTKTKDGREYDVSGTGSRRKVSDKGEASFDWRRWEREG